MRELIEKKAKIGKIFAYVTLALIALFVCAIIFVIPNVEFDISYPIIMSITTMTMVCGIIYIVSFNPTIKNVKWLSKKGMENIADDIILEKPTLPKTKIYCGRKAFYSKKPNVIIPYSEIAWVHLFEQRAYGIPVQKSVIIYTKDGIKFSLKSDENEVKWLLSNYLMPNSPNLIIGYGAAQNARYKALYPNASKFSFKK